MPSYSPPYTLLLCLGVLLILHTAPVSAFGAGNIASLSGIEGQNWRHGDIEDTLLNILMSRAAGGKKFSKLDVKRVYFGNWLRDYSQAVDVGTVKYVSAEAIRLILWVLGFMSFGYGSKEFEVTTDRLGSYQPTEHIDNPKDYADNIDARKYDPRLRGPVDERRELAINPQTGLKNYIATENLGIATSAGLIRKVFGRSIQLGRQYAHSHNKADLYEALRLLGTGCHCLEDYSAHSNYTELALIELGERGVFPHVGRQTQMQLPGARQSVYPIITGTFGGTDFLHSVMGEFSDKATQSELQELQGTIESSQSSGQGNIGILQSLLSSIPSGIFGGKDEAGKAEELQMNAQAAQMQNMNITPRQPEAWTRQLQQIAKQIGPIIEWHDEIMQSITETVEKIPILPALIEQVTDQINIFVFSLMAPFILPIIEQVKKELATGSSEIIESSREKQHIVFRDDRCSDPTHSMLSKDHFSNILNEPAGKVASQVLKWVVPQLIAAWDDERIDIDRTLARIVNGVFHHPALRDRGDDGAVDGRRGMFQVVQQWWSQKDQREQAIMRDQLSRDGVQQGRNHKEGVHDGGHGCGKPLGMPGTKTASSSGAIGGLPVGNILGQINSAISGQSQFDAGAGRPSMGASSNSFSKLTQEAVGGGAIGGLVGGLVGGVGGDLLGNALGGSGAKKQSYQSQEYGQDGSYKQNYTQTGYNQQQGGQPVYGQAQYSQTTYPGGGQREEFQRYGQGGSFGGSGYGEQVIQESRPTYGGGYEKVTETRHEKPGGVWESNLHEERRTSGGEYSEESRHNEGYGGYRKDSDSDDDRKKSKHKKKHNKHGAEEDSDDDNKYKTSSYGQEQSYGEGRTSYGEGRTSYGEGRRGSGEYGAQAGYGGHRQEYNEGYGGQTEYGGGRQEPREEYGTHSGYGGQRKGSDEVYGSNQNRAESRDNEPTMPGAFGGNSYGEEPTSYGGGRGGFESREGYGRRENYEEQERDSGEGRGGGFGGFGGEERSEEESYGGGRNYGDDEENTERRGYGDDY